MEQKIIFLNSFSPRTGHNFTSEALKVFCDHQVLAHNRSETRLSILLNSYYSIREGRVRHDSDRIFLDYLFLKDLREKIISKSNSRFIMIKDTSFVGVDRLPEIFPNDIHILLLRDPARVFYSLFKAMNLTKKNKKNSLKKAGKATGLYPYYYSKKISSKILNILPEFSKHEVIRYEDFVNLNEGTLLHLKELFNSPKTMEQIKAEIDEIPVINSSFFEEVKAKKIWEMKTKTKDFDPVKRKGGNFFVRKGIELGSKKLRKRLGYI